MRPNAIAIVGLACRFPGAADPDAFWRNLAAGVESIRRFSRDEVVAAGLPEALADHPSFVSAHGALDDIEGFDAAFFGYSPGDGARIDPQQRLFLECAYEALERGGFVPREDGPVVGVFAGCGVNGYLIRNVFPALKQADVAAEHQAILGAEKDFLTARVAYKLGLSGPAVTVQAACATSLVAVHMACQSLLSGECDLALAGGASLRVPQASGYLFGEGGIHSADGRCRAFDAEAGGTVGGSGAGVVVLKRLEEAVRDRDPIDAVLLGTAVNNDGAHKISFTAPGVRGQAAVIAEARAVAGVAAETIGYAEMHGTATALGDPIEIAALRQALGDAWHPGWRCYIGSVKTNIGHLDAAAGVAGLIKTVLALRRKAIPPSLHFRTPNPKIDFESGPLRIATALTPWDRIDAPRRASVSSFGLGGSNAHVVLEEAPPQEPIAERAAWRLFPLSARTPAALDRMRSRLADHVSAHDEARPGDVAWTLAQGRQPYSHRAFTVSRTIADLSDALGQRRWHTGEQSATAPRIAFLFPGQGAQQVGAGRELYASEPVFAAAMDECADALARAGSVDVRTLLFQEPSAAAEDTLRRTVHAQAVLFALGYALAALWRSWGIVPDGVVGHSSGEYAAAVCAGVMSLDGAAKALMARARLMDGLPAGVMAAVGMSEAELRATLPDGLYVAAVNAPTRCTVAGSDTALRALEARLSGRGVVVHRLQTAHAFHSPAVEPVLSELRTALGSLQLQAPQIAFYAAVLGERADDEQVADHELWVRQIREPVLFGPAIQALAEDGLTAFVELGSGTTLAGLAKQNVPAGTLIVPGLARDGESKALLTGLGHLWLAGAAVEWAGVFGQDDGRRIALPTYPFERTRHWIEAAPRQVPAIASSAEDRTVKFFVPSWTRSALPATPGHAGLAGRWLVVGDDALAREIANGLRKAGAEVLTARGDEGTFPSAERVLITAILQARGAGAFESMIRIARDIARRGDAVREICAITCGAVDVTGGEPLDAWQATVLGPLLVMPTELPGLHCRAIDVDLSEGLDYSDAILAEVRRPPGERVVALRHRHRWALQITPATVPEAVAPDTVIRADGVYLITGGLGGVGLSIAQAIAARARVHVALIGRRGLDSTSAQAARVAAIESAGSVVRAYEADCADPIGMGKVVADLMRRHGRIDGVVHAAGVPGGGVIARRTDTEMTGVLRPKTTGTGVLVDALADAKPDFIAFFSSINAYVAVPGQADYAAANAYLDVMAAALRRKGIRATSINWDAWHGTGMTAAADLPEPLRSSRDEELSRIGLDPDRACDAFFRVIGADIGQVIVSRRSSVSLSGTTESATVEPGHRTSSDGTANAIDGLAEIWRGLLGVSEVKPADDFFQLGGHSLLATSVIFQIRERWGSAVSIDEVFTHPTLESLASLIEARAAGGDREALLL